MERQKRTEKEGPLEMEGKSETDEAVRETGWDPQLVTRARQGARGMALARGPHCLPLSYSYPEYLGQPVLGPRSQRLM